ncbi:MAG: hypothetical protein COU47_01170 [Candidatus Niyogibacteria bacterium CG10_big_fil_rev_8_21_14_0_10_46_36]|uniref:Uncharacterized protein n=1 Tax=Candidatus Niyogibacteria bacterium CG10_big_fil_rev_8_21_14_0_10_46_36 TaxID=1974726 RepID=A0A2H0TDR6_9BACT|nr:MAG: hypothetical protein COU47_01170 [Candidatus Niyogibacteria bacterium CG10_big_fil_rev_8_21_14_0_10_46_36]
MAQKKITDLRDLGKELESAEISVPAKTEAPAKETKETQAEVPETQGQSSQKAEGMNDFLLLSTIAKKATQEEDVQESREHFNEMAKDAGVSRNEGVAYYAGVYDTLAVLKEKAEAERKKIDGLVSDPTNAPLVEAGRKRIADVEQNIYELERIRKTVEENEFLREEVMMRRDLYVKVQNTCSRLEDPSFEKTVPVHVRMRSLRGVLQGLRGIKTPALVYVADAPAENAIRASAKEFFVPADVTKEDQKIKSAYEMLQEYALRVGELNEKELALRVKEAGSFLLPKDILSGEFELVTKRRGEEFSLSIEKVSFKKDRLGALLSGNAVPVGNALFVCDIRSEKRIRDGETIPDYTWGRMLLCVSPSGDEVCVDILGIVPHEDPYYMNLDIVAAGKIFKRRKEKDSYEWETGTLSFFIKKGNVGSVRHYYVRESLKYAARYHEEKEQARKERRQETEQFKERLQDFSDVSSLERPVTFLELSQGKVGILPFRNPSWKPKGVTGHIVSDGEFVEYRTPTGRDDRKELRLMMLPEPGKKMRLRKFISDRMVQRLMQKNTLEKDIYRARKENKLARDFGDVKRVEEVFTDASAKPAESAYFTCVKQLGRNWAEFVVYYNAANGTMSFVKAMNRFSRRRVTERRLGVVMKKEMSLEALPPKTRSFLRDAYMFSRHLEDAGSVPVWFQSQTKDETPDTEDIAETNISAPPAPPDNEHVLAGKTETPLSGCSELSKSEVAKLAAAGITTFEEFLGTSAETLKGIKGVGPKTLEKFEALQTARK